MVTGSALLVSSPNPTHRIPTPAQIRQAEARAKKEMAAFHAQARRSQQRMQHLVASVRDLVNAHLEYEATVEAAARKRARVNRRAMRAGLAFIQDFGRSK